MPESIIDKLAGLVLRRYEVTWAVSGRVDRYPQERPVAQYIVEHAPEVGLAIVAMPEPNGENGGWIDLTLGDEEVSVAEDEVVFTATAGCYSPNEARQMAAALLAAANLADLNEQALMLGSLEVQS